MKQLSAWHELYLSRSDIRPATARFKRKAHEFFVEWFGNMDPQEVTLAMAEDYRVLLAKGRSKASANGYLRVYKPFWCWLFRHGQIKQNPFDGLRLYRVTESRRKTFSAEELGRIIKVSSRLWRVRICLGLLGLRRGECMNLVVRDLNWSAQESYILLSPKKPTSNTWPWLPKNHQVRMVALPESMCFDGITVKLHKDIMMLIDELKDSPYFCLEKKYFDKLIRWQEEETLDDTHISDPTGNFQRSFRLLQRNASVSPSKRYHELRAAFATKMIAENGLERAADALGHSNVEITRRYDRRTMQSLVAEIGRITSFCYKT